MAQKQNENQQALDACGAVLGIGDTIMFQHQFYSNSASELVKAKIASFISRADGVFIVLDDVNIDISKLWGARSIPKSKRSDLCIKTFKQG